MTDATGAGRTDRASRLVRAPRGALYRALLDPQAVATWLPPRGMTGEVLAFEAREGGAYRIRLSYGSTDHRAAGKTSKHADVAEGVFVSLDPDRRVVQRVEFESADPAFAGAMTISWILADAPGGTEVAALCENVPSGISPQDHAEGLRSSLENLAAFVE